jgi:peroxiredoxin
MPNFRISFISQSSRHLLNPLLLFKFAENTLVVQFSMMSSRKKKGSNLSRSAVSLILTGMVLIIISFAVVILSAREKLTTSDSTNINPVPRTINAPLPPLELIDINGTEVSLAEMKNQVVLVNNWATWCPPCRAEMPDLQAYFHAHEKDGFILVGINAGDSQGQVEEFVREYGLTFPIWLDPAGKALRVFQNNALPSSYLIDRSGIIRQVWLGAVSLETLEAYVTPLLVE